MGRPEVTLENYRAVRKFYSEHEQGPRASWVGHLLMGLAFRSNITFAEGAPEGIRQVFAEGKQMVLSVKHSTAADQYVVAGMATRVPVLRPLMGRTMIPAKASLFHNQFPIPKTSRAINFPPLRYGVDEMGAFPMHTPKNVAKMKGNPDEIVAMRKNANAMQEDIAVERLSSGKHNMAYFAEGTRYARTGDPKVVNELMPGMGRIIGRVLERIDSGESESKGLALLSVGLYYGEGDDRHIWTPSLHIDRPEIDLPTTPEGITDLAAVRMQRCQDVAVEQFMLAA